jgi:hypothetical protein
MNLINHAVEGPAEWTAEFVENCPRYTPSFRDSVSEHQLKDVGGNSQFVALSPDASIAAVASPSKVRLYTSIGVEPVHVSRILKAPKGARIQACAISGSLLAFVTSNELVVYGLNNIFIDESDPLERIDITRDTAWAPTNLTVVDNQRKPSENDSSTWTWIAVGVEGFVKLFLFRKYTTTWCLQSDQPRLDSRLDSPVTISASSNLTEDPYNSIFVAGYLNKVLCWDLRATRESRHDLSATTKLAVPCEAVSIFQTYAATCL